jgi:leucyl-tRNA synthetase
MDEQYDSKEAEQEVQAYWRKNGTFEVTENSTREKFYCLSMFPYPSGNLHMGHVRNYTLGDVIGRYHRLQGKNVLQPIGWDAFGLPAENAAIENNVPPARWTEQNIDYMRKQMGELGYSFDWSREFATCDPSYYHWEQWLFTRLFRKGLAYKKSAWVNWDPVDQTVLANEQVIDGRGWRSDAPVERRELEQWFVRVTAYADELLASLDELPGWPEHVKTMQRNWIGRSTGAEIRFAIDGGDELAVYTTRPDTLMGATYLAIAPQHELAAQAAASKPEVAAFVAACARVKSAEADLARLPKEGMATGLHAIHPLTGEALPIWVANFVLMEYGSGAVMSVPGHDQRDWEFARKYGLTIKQVIAPASDSKVDCDLSTAAFVEHGILVNSGEFDGLDFAQAFSQITDKLTEVGRGEVQVNYRLRDWGVSRQRYWGCPIPMINCDACGPVPVPDEDLPVVLPRDVAFDGVQSPLANMPEWLNTPCPECGRDAVRETDTFDTFMESSWYFSRFESPDCATGMVDDRAGYWQAVDHYIGGEEHAILHLLYARFYHKVMRDEGLVEPDEPFVKLLALGMVLDGDGEKMSKSKGNAVDPQPFLDKYGADALRMAMMFAAPPEQSFKWSDHGVDSAGRWLRRLWKTVADFQSPGAVEALDPVNLSDAQRDLRRMTHEIIVKAADDYGRRLAFNTVIAAVMSLMNEIQRFTDNSPQGRAVVVEALSTVIIVMSPVTPHICHQLWRALRGEALEDAEWPQVDASALARREVEVIIQINGKLRARLTMAPDASQEAVTSAAESLPNVSKFLVDKQIRKVIHVPNKLVNYVVA